MCITSQSIYSPILFLFQGTVLKETGTCTSVTQDACKRYSWTVPDPFKVITSSTDPPGCSHKGGVAVYWNVLATSSVQCTTASSCVCLLKRGIVCLSVCPFCFFFSYFFPLLFCLFPSHQLIFFIFNSNPILPSQIRLLS